MIESKSVTEEARKPRPRATTNHYRPFEGFAASLCRLERRSSCVSVGDPGKSVRIHRSRNEISSVTSLRILTLLYLCWSLWSEAGATPECPSLFSWCAAAKG